MWLQRTPWGWVLGMVLAGSTAAQGQGVLRWPGSGMGLQAPDLQVDLQAGYTGPSPMERRLAQSQPQGVKLVGRSARLGDLGVYGRFGLGSRSNYMGNGPASTDSAMSYGVGLSWDLSPRASAVLGWDSYDMRTAIGDRDVRATSLGLQWRY
jgi:hypothetical protein